MRARLFEQDLMARPGSRPGKGKHATSFAGIMDMREAVLSWLRCWLTEVRSCFQGRCPVLEGAGALWPA